MRPHQNIAQLVLEQVKAGAGDVSRLRGLDGAIRVLKRVVKRVELVGKELALTGAAKREVAIEVILLLVKMPRWLTMPIPLIAPEGIARMALGYAIDVAVDALNDAWDKEDPAL